MQFAHLHGSLRFVLGVVRDVRNGVEELADAVAAVGGDHRAARRPRHLRDGLAQVAVGHPRSHQGHGGRQRVVGALDQAPRALVH